MSCGPITQKFGLIHNLAVEENEDEDGDTIASRFTAKILDWLISGFMAKDKNVRYRVLQTVSEMVSHLGAIEYVFNVFPSITHFHSGSEDAYKTLRAALLDRINDRETSVRCQAVMSLAKLCISEDPEDLEEVSMIEVLLDTLAHDPSAYVVFSCVLLSCFLYLSPVMSAAQSFWPFPSTRAHFLACLSGPWILTQLFENFFIPFWGN